MGSISMAEQSVVITRTSSCYWIVHFDYTVRRNENCIGPQRRMLDIVFLQMAEPQDAAGQNRPKFFLLKTSPLKAALIDLIIERALRKLKKCINLKEGHTKLILRVCHDFHQRDHMPIVFQLRLLVTKGLLYFEKSVFIVTADLPQQKFLLCLPVLQVSQPLVGVLLQDLELVDHELILLVEIRGGSGSHFKRIK